MASGRGKGDPMAGLLSNLGGIDPNLFNKPTMGQLKSKQPAPAAPPKSTSTSVRSDTIAAVGSPVRPGAGASDSFSSRKSSATQGPQQTGGALDDLDSFFGSAKPSAAASYAGSYAASPANMASPAASLGLPDDRSDFDLFGNLNSSTTQPVSNQAAAVRATMTQQHPGSVDPFDLFGEGATVPASAAAASQAPKASSNSADDSLFGDVDGYQGASQGQHAAVQSTAAQRQTDRQTDRAQATPRHPPLPAKSPGSGNSTPSSSQSRPQAPRRSRSFTGGGLPSSQAATPSPFSLSNSSARSSAPQPPATKGSFTAGRADSGSSLDTTAAIQGSPNEPQPTPSSRPRRSSEDGRAGRRGPLEEGASGDRHPDPYMHEDPYMSKDSKGSSNMEQTAKTWLTGGQKWLKKAGKQLATAAKEGAAEVQKRMEAADIKLTKGKGVKVGDDGEEVPAYYQQWAAKIQDMSPARQADVLDQLGEDDRMIVRRILDQAAVRRSNSGSMAGSAHQPRTHSQDSHPPPYPGTNASQRKASRPASPSHRQEAVTSQSAHVSRQNSNELTSQVSSSRHQQQAQRPRTAAAMGVFDSQPDQAPYAEADLPEAPAQAPAPQLRQPAPAEQAHARQQPAAAEADFLGFGGDTDAEESFMPDSPPAEPSGFSIDSQTAATPHPQAPAPTPPAATPDNLADFFSSPAAGPASSAGDRSSTAHIDDMFSAAPRPPPARPNQAPQAPPASSASSSAPRPAARPVPAASKPAAPSSMIDFGDEAALLAQNPELYKGLEAVEGEPEVRKQLREKRLREMHQRMQAQLAEKQARDAAESSEKDEKVDLRNRVVKPKIEAWQQGKKDNIRALLSTLHTVLWEGSGWNPPNMTDLVETNKVKKQYMKANLIVHPDKVKQKGGTVEQIVIADMAFDALKTAWAKFEAGELRK